jgi:hypothetical protein
VGGLRIWWFIRQRLQRPIQLFRTTAHWVASESRRGGKLVSGLEKVALQRLRTELESLTDTDAASAREVIDVLLEQGRKIEQERF